MIIWVDAQRSPHLAPWIEANFVVKARSVGFLGLRDMTDAEIFRAARDAGAVVITKDIDFVALLEIHGPPPSLLWITCGNTSNVFLRDLPRKTLPRALDLIERGETLVEITDLV